MPVVQVSLTAPTYDEKITLALMVVDQDAIMDSVKWNLTPEIPM